jgi:beta-mannosidase
VLGWQLNDTWPGISWALVDVDMHRKPAFYIVKRALALAVVGLKRVVTKEPSYIVFNSLPKKCALDVWAVNGLLRELKVVLRLSTFGIETGNEIKLPVGAEKLTLKKPDDRDQENQYPSSGHDGHRYIFG